MEHYLFLPSLLFLFLCLRRSVGIWESCFQCFWVYLWTYGNTKMQENCQEVFRWTYLFPSVGCKSQKSRWVLFFIFISSLLSLVYFALTYPTTGGLSILVTLIKQNLFCCYLPPSRQVWTSNPNQFAEDEDDDTFSFSVRIAVQDVLLVSEWNSFNIQFTPSVLVCTPFSYGAHLLCYN